MGTNYTLKSVDNLQLRSRCFKQCTQRGALGSRLTYHCSSALRVAATFPAGLLQLSPQNHIRTWTSALYCPTNPISGQLVQPCTQTMSWNTCSTSLALVTCLVSWWLFPPLILNIIQVYTEQQHWLLELSNQERTCSGPICLEKISCWRHHSPKPNSSLDNNQRFLQKTQ